jgi:hypothetical protein
MRASARPREEAEKRRFAMKPSSPSRPRFPLALIACLAFASPALTQEVTFAPYLQLGANGKLGPSDQIVIARQTNESSPNPSAYKVEFYSAAHDRFTLAPKGRVIDNYLTADPTLPLIPGAYGPHTNYTAVLQNLQYDTVYHYTVTGPGLPSGGFASSFRTRKLGSVFSFAVEGDEGYFPVVPNSAPARIVDYEARIAHLVYNASDIQLPNEPSRPSPDFIVNTGDNVYNQGDEDNYRDFFFPVYNSDRDSNETGAPIPPQPALLSRRRQSRPGQHRRLRQPARRQLRARLQRQPQRR